MLTFWFCCNTVTSFNGWHWKTHIHYWFYVTFFLWRKIHFFFWGIAFPCQTWIKKRLRTNPADLCDFLPDLLFHNPQQISIGLLPFLHNDKSQMLNLLFWVSKNTLTSNYPQIFLEGNTLLELLNCLLNLHPSKDISWLLRQYSGIKRADVLRRKKL